MEKSVVVSDLIWNTCQINLYMNFTLNVNIFSEEVGVNFVAKTFLFVLFRATACYPRHILFLFPLKSTFFASGFLFLHILLSTLVSHYHCLLPDFFSFSCGIYFTVLCANIFYFFIQFGKTQILCTDVVLQCSHTKIYKMHIFYSKSCRKTM